MAFTPGGPIYTALHAMRRTVAASTTFQALTGAASEAEALGHVIYVRKSLERDPNNKTLLLVPRTRAIVSLDDGCSAEGGGTGVLDHIIPVYVRLELAVPDYDDGTVIASDLMMCEEWFHTKWAAIVSEMLTTSRASNGTYIAADTPFVLKERADYYFAEDDLNEGCYAVGLTFSLTSGI